MRSVSGARNRLLLVLAGVVALLLALWLGSGALGLVDRWPAADSVLLRGDSTPAVLASAPGTWLLPVAAAVAVLAAIAGILLLIAQVPTRTASAPFRIAGEDSTVPLGSMEPGVLERALSEHVEGIAGVLDASAQVSGSSSSPWVQATVSISQDAEAGWVVDSVRELLAEDVRTVLGTEPKQVDLLLSLRSSATSTRTRLENPASSSRGAGQQAASRPAPATTA
jgi:hypothetical protein